jgi:hypothetical protein
MSTVPLVLFASTPATGEDGKRSWIARTGTPASHAVVRIRFVCTAGSRSRWRGYTPRSGSSTRGRYGRRIIDGDLAALFSRSPSISRLRFSQEWSTTCNVLAGTEQVIFIVQYRPFVLQLFLFGYCVTCFRRGSGRFQIILHILS